MKTITTTKDVYEFNELSDDAKTRAINNLRLAGFPDFDLFAIDAEDAMQALGYHTSINWDADGGYIGLPDGTDLTIQTDYFPTDDADLALALKVNTFARFVWEDKSRGRHSFMGFVAPVIIDDDIADAMPDDYFWLMQDPDVASGRAFHEEMAERSQTYAMIWEWCERLTRMVTDTWVACVDHIYSDEYLIDFIETNEMGFDAEGGLA